VLADGLTVRTFEHTSVAVGAHHYKVVPHNSAGDGTESVVLEIAIAQENAA
jgi:hypothetical protein